MALSKRSIFHLQNIKKAILKLKNLKRNKQFPEGTSHTKVCGMLQVTFSEVCGMLFDGVWYVVIENDINWLIWNEFNCPK